MAVTANQLLIIKDPEHLGAYPVLAAKHLYKGAMSFTTAAGLLSDVIAAGVNVFAGINSAEYDNSGGASGDITAETWTEGDWLGTGSGFTQATVGAVMYATDNYTITTTSTNNTKIGRCVAYVSSTQVYVALDVVQT